MSRFWSITKVILKSSLNLTGFRKNKGKRAGKNSSTFFLLVFGLLFLFVAVSQFMTYREMFSAAHQVGYLNSYVESMIPTGIIFLLVFSMTILLSVFFLSNDNAVFLPLPIKPHELFFSRFVSVLVYTYFIELVFILPLLLAYDFVVIPSAIAYLSQFLIFLIIPIIPIGFGFLLSLLFAKIFNISKHKDAFSIVMMSVLIIVIVAIQILSGINSEPSNPEAIPSMSNPFKFLNFYTGFFYRGIINDNAFGLGQVAIICAISIGFISICLGIAMVFYTKSLKGSDDGKAKRKKGNLNNALNKSSYSSNQLMNFLSKESKTLFRTPTYVFNLVVTPLLFLLVFAISFTVYGVSDGFRSVGALLDQLRRLVGPTLNMNNGYIILIALCLTSFISSLSPIASTAISRETTNAYMLKTYPVKAMTIINAKIAFAFIIDFIISLVIFLAATLILQVPFIIFLCTMILSILINLVTKYVLILIDLKYPTLNASNETALVKQSKSAIFGILIDLAIAVGLGLLAYICYLINLNGWIVFGVLTLIVGLLNVWVILFIKYKGNRVFDRI